MSRHFSIPTVLRMTPNALLREFFDKLGHRLLCIDWKRLKERQVEPLVVAMSWLTLRQREEIETALRGVFDLACDSGWQAILEAARRRGELELLDSLSEQAGPYHRSMQVWLHHPGIFDQAAILHQVDTLTRWRRRNDFPHVEPRTDRQALLELQEALSDLLRREQGRGHRCTVEHFRREDGTDYFCAYPDDFVQTITMHDEDGHLAPRPVRQTFEIVFAYNEQEGAIELFAAVPSHLKPKLERLFGDVILDEYIGPRQPGSPYSLNHLKQLRFRLETDPLDYVSAEICKLRLDIPATSGRITLEPLKHGPTHDIYEIVNRSLHEDNVSLDLATISMATFRFEFRPLDGRRPGSLTFDVTYPDRCNVRTRRPERIDLARKYLKRWRIADVG